MNATESMKETTQTCKLRKEFNLIELMIFIDLDAFPLDPATELTALKTLTAVMTKE